MSDENHDRLYAISADAATLERFCKTARRLASTLRQSFEPFDPGLMIARDSMAETIDSMGRLFCRIDTNFKETLA